MAGKKKGGDKPAKKKTTRAAVIPRPPQGVRLGKWLADYIRCVTSPHKFSASGIPDDDVRPSEKVMSWGKGSMTVGTTNGEVLFKPGAAADNTNAAQVYTSDNTWAGTAFSATAGSGITANGLNVPYVGSQFGLTPDKLQCRLVAALLRIKPTSTPLTINGDVVGVTSRDNNTLVGLTVAQCNNLPESDRETAPALMNKWYTLRYHPLPEESDYESVSPNLPIMGFLVTAADNIVWDWEAYQVFEYIGQPASNRVTASHSDPVGLGAFWSAVSGKASYFRPTTASDEEFLSQILIRTGNELLEQSCPCPPTAF